METQNNFDIDKQPSVNPESKEDLSNQYFDSEMNSLYSSEYQTEDMQSIIEYMSRSDPEFNDSLSMFKFYNTNNLEGFLKKLGFKFYSLHY